MQEIVSKRTYNSKFHDNGDGTFTLQSHAGHVHYKENGAFLESDFTPEDKGMYWEMVKHNYRLRVAKDFAAPILIQYTNVYEGANHSITYEPQSIAWYKPATNNVQVFRNQQSVQGVWNSEKNSFYYTNAFGNGIDFEITIQRSGFKKEVVIPNKPAAFPTAPGAGYKLVALFKYGGSGLRVLKDTGEEWDTNTFLDHNGGFELPETANPLAKSFIRPAYAVDSDNRQVSLRVAWVKRNNQLWQVKEIPLGLFEQATFPVRFDTTTSYYSGSGDGQMNVGTPENITVWSTLYGYTGECTYGTSTGSPLTARCDKGAGHYRVYRISLPFDLTALSGATVSGVNLKLTSTGVLNDSLQTCVVSHTRSSNTSLVNNEWKLSYFGTTEFATREQLSSTAGTTTTFAFNSSGISYVGGKVGDWAVIGLLEQYTMTNTDPSTTTRSYSIYSSEYTGESYDPTLEITYTASATSSIKSIAGVAIADLKSLAGVAKADIKSVAGVSNVS